MVEKTDNAELGEWKGFFEAFQSLLSEAEIEWQQQEAQTKERGSGATALGAEEVHSGSVSSAVNP